MKIKNCKKAFTLAEILVTLGIIGVIASMTIPNLVQDVQDAQLKTAWKKAFADFNQSAAMLRNSNAGSIKGICSDKAAGTEMYQCFRDKMLDFMNYTRICQNQQNRGNCWTANAKMLNGNSWTQNAPGAVLSSGVSLMFGYQAPNCDKVSYGFPICGWVYADINGLKSPNTFGKDIYGMWIKEASVVPMGIDGDTYAKPCIPTAEGQACSSLFLYQ